MHVVIRYTLCENQIENRTCPVPCGCAVDLDPATTTRKLAKNHFRSWRQSRLVEGYLRGWFQSLCFACFRSIVALYNSDILMGLRSERRVPCICLYIRYCRRGSCYCFICLRVPHACNDPPPVALGAEDVWLSRCLGGVANESGNCDVTSLVGLSMWRHNANHCCYP